MSTKTRSGERKPRDTKSDSLRPDSHDEDAHLKLFLVRQDASYEVRYIPYEVPQRPTTRPVKTRRRQSDQFQLMMIVLSPSQKRPLNEDEEGKSEGTELATHRLTSSPRKVRLDLDTIGRRSFPRIGCPSVARTEDRGPRYSEDRGG